MGERDGEREWSNTTSVSSGSRAGSVIEGRMGWPSKVWSDVRNTVPSRTAVVEPPFIRLEPGITYYHTIADLLLRYTVEPLSKDSLKHP